MQEQERDGDLLAYLTSDTPSGEEKATQLYAVSREDWPLTLAEVLEPTAVGFGARLDIISTIVWRLRETGVRPEIEKELKRMPDFIDGYVYGNMLIVLLMSARFEYNHRLIERILGMPNIFPVDGDRPFEAETQNLVAVFRMFSRLAKGKVVPTEELANLVNELREPKLKSVLLQGLWLSPTGNYGDAMVQLGDELLAANPHDHVNRMRRAEGYARIKEYPKAIRDVDMALAELGPNENKLHAEYVRDRGFIVREYRQHEQTSKLREQTGEVLEEEFAKQRAAFQKEIAEVRDRFDQRVQKYSVQLRGQTNDMLFRVMEIVSLFVTLVGLLAATVGVALAGELNFLERILILLSSSVFLIFFFIAVRFAARPRAAEIEKAIKAIGVE